MRRITMWITMTIAVVALLVCYQLNAAGTTGKGEGGDHEAPAVVSTDGGARSTGKPGENK